MGEGGSLVFGLGKGSGRLGLMFDSLPYSD